VQVRVARWHILTAIVLALAAAGCGGSSVGRPAHDTSISDPGSAAAGAKVFVSAGCASCHTLAAAKAKGNIGPNLDQLKPGAALVMRQVRTGGIGMPSFKRILTARQIQDVAAFVARSTKGSAVAAQSFGSIAASFRPDHTKVAQCGHTWTCYEQAFGNLAYYDGARSALTTYVHAIKTNPDVRADCHLIAHAIGAGSYVRYRDPGKAFVAAGQLAMTCASGFYHGVLQRALNGVQPSGLDAAARRLCASPAANVNYFILSQCIHGLGHGLMIYTGYDLPRALQTCDHLANRWDQTTCTGGVFMENFTTSMRIRSPWLKASDPLFPCDYVSTRDKLYCYLQVTSHLLDVTHGSWRATVGWCRKAEKGWVATCFQSLGRDASGRTLQYGAGILKVCALAGDMERECIYGAARDIANTDAGAGRATPFCEQVPSAMRGYCFYGVGSILGGFHVYGKQRRASCEAAVPKEYWRDCFAGARA
jgi:mono/diheme cytochrome c family protein